jgi:hypothetical protein
LIRGESANAGRLVTLLEDSRLFTQAAPRSPTTKIQPGPGEIFDLGAQLKPMPQPTPLPPAVIEKAAAPAAATAAIPTPTAVIAPAEPAKPEAPALGSTAPSPQVPGGKS